VSARDNQGWQPDPPDDAAQYQMAYPFLDQSRSFAMGFQCGAAVARMQLQHQRVKVTVCTRNVEQLRLAAKHYGYELAWNIADNTANEWAEVTMTRTSSAGGPRG
jgi:hypothetical protein